MFTEEEVMALIEEAFESGYDSAIDELEEAMTESESEEFDTEYPELFTYNETKSINKFKQAMITDNEMEKGRYKPVLFTADPKATEENIKNMKAIRTSVGDKNAHFALRDSIGRIKKVRSMKHSHELGIKGTPYLDRTDNFVATNKSIKDIKDPEERKERIANAKETLRKLKNGRKLFGPNKEFRG